MRTVFLVQHVHQLSNANEDVKVIGVYSSRREAENAVRRASDRPGFKGTPEGFSIDEYALDEDEWREGFATV